MKISDASRQLPNAAWSRRKIPIGGGDPEADEGAVTSPLAGGVGR